MENRDNQHPSGGQNSPTSQETDLSKAQSPQQPRSDQQSEGLQSQPGKSSGQSQQQQPSGQADYGSAGQSDSATQQRRDIEGGTATGQANDVEGNSSFVGSAGTSDTSSELIDEDKDESSDCARDGQGSTE